MAQLVFRPFTIDDFEDVTALWVRAGIRLTLSDEFPEIEKMLVRNPDTCFLGCSEGHIVAAVMGSWDGRRGFVHHLAIEPRLHGRGFGRLMLSELERRFREMNVVKMTFFIEKSNIDVVKFYEKLGYILREDLVAMSKTLREK